MIASEIEIGEPERVPIQTAESVRNRDRSLAQSIGWNAAGDWATQIFTWASFLAVMRLLRPADFGLAAMAGLLNSYLAGIQALGIPRAVVTLRELTDDQLAQLNSVGLALGLGLFGVSVAAARPIAFFFHEPRIAPLVIVICFGLILQGLQGVPQAQLVKQMRFRLLSLLGGASALATAVLTLGFALLGFGYWALVLGSMLTGVARAVVILWIQPCRLAWPHLESIREPIKFGWRVMVSLLAMNTQWRLDDFTAGKMLGQTALGFYGNAWALANIPLEKVASMVTTVIPTYLAAVQNEPAALRRYLRTLTEAIALATFPATVGLGLVAPELVPLLLGHKWDGMIGPLQVLTFYAGFRSIAALLSKVLTAVGDVRYVMWNDLATLVVLAIAFYVGSFGGITGIAWGWVWGYPLVALPLYRRTFAKVAMSVDEYFRALRPALEGTLAMTVAVELVKHSAIPARSLLLRLLMEIATGAFACIGVLWLRHRERMRVLLRSAKNLWPAMA